VFKSEFLRLVQLQSNNAEDAKFQAQKINLYWEELRDIPVPYLVRAAKDWPHKSQYMPKVSEWRANALRLFQIDRENEQTLNIDREREIFEQREAEFQRDYQNYLKLPLAQRQQIEEAAKRETKTKDTITGEFRELLDRLQSRAVKGRIVELYREQFKQK
jgi:hypothetical protein